jgi:hypothetical protein
MPAVYTFIQVGSEARILMKGEGLLKLCVVTIARHWAKYYLFSRIPKQERGTSKAWAYMSTGILSN